MQNKNKKIGDYLIQGFLGRGQFGQVYKVKCISNGKIFAMKQIQRSSFMQNKQMIKLLKTEVQIMEKINHPNVIHLYELLESKNNFYLIIDFCNDGDLQQYFSKKKIKYLKEEDAIIYLKQIMNAFQELRKHKVIHRDFKLQNILVHNGIVKIADFGMAKAGQDIANTVVGSYMTMAPELFQVQSEGNVNSYCSKADLWSVGFVFYQILFGDVPFFGLSPAEIFNDIKSKHGKLKFPRKIHDSTADLLNKLLQMNPSKRIDWSDFFNHEFFDVFDQKDEQIPLELQQSVQMEFQQNKQVSKKDNFIQQNEKENIPEELLQSKKIIVNEKSKTTENDYSEFIYDLYMHEKNKILFLLYSLRLIRKLMKFQELQSIEKVLALSAIFLMKKVVAINQLILYALEGHQNILNTKNFDEFLTSEYYENVSNDYSKNQQSYNQYFDYLVHNALEQYQDEEIKQTLANLIEENISLEQLDQIIQKYYIDIVKQPVAISAQSDLYHQFLLMVVSMFYSINCEKFFPFEVEQTRFDWEAFFQIHESMSNTDLIRIISQLIQCLQCIIQEYQECIKINHQKNL